MTYKYNITREKALHMDTNSNTSSSSFLFSRFFFRVLVVVGFVCFMVFSSLVSGGGTGQTTTRHWSEETLKHDDEQVVVGKDKGVVVNHDAQLDFNYMSKRRVPNGPDPIHNRRAGNSGRPPGQT